MPDTTNTRHLPILGQTLRRVVQFTDRDNGDALAFVLDDQLFFMMFHERDCCESVALDEIVGDLDDLVGTPILQAEEVSRASDDPKDEEDEWGDVTEWTFYLLRTIRGSVTLRWCGTSNGYYSMAVNEKWSSGNPDDAGSQSDLTGWHVSDSEDTEVELDRIESQYGLNLRENGAYF